VVTSGRGAAALTAGPAGRGSARPGFTIIELVVAMVVAGVVAVTAYAAVAAASDAAARMRADPRTALAGLTARATLSGWLRAATADVEPFSGAHRRAGLSGHDHDEVTFGVADGGPRCPGACRVHLAVTGPPSAAPSGLVAVLTPLARPAAPAETVLVAPGAAGLQLRYRASFTEREPWLRAWAAAATPPAVVRLQVTFDGAVAARDASPLLGMPLTVSVAGVLP
jgi:prepilin-type N-terminal cleavage/methylation domain-containing protein